MAAPHPIELFGLGVSAEIPPRDRAAPRESLLRDAAGPDRTRIVAYQTPGLDAALLRTSATRRARVGSRRRVRLRLFRAPRHLLAGRTTPATATDRGTIGTTTGKVSMADRRALHRARRRHEGLLLRHTDNPGRRSRDHRREFPTARRCHVALELLHRRARQRLLHLRPGSATSWPGDFGFAESNPDRSCASWPTTTTSSSSARTRSSSGRTPGAPTSRSTPIPGRRWKWGLAAKDSVARFDDGLCLSRGKTLQGQVIAAVLQGYRWSASRTTRSSAKFASYTTRLRRGGLRLHDRRAPDVRRELPHGRRDVDVRRLEQ
jgi:hypothetical protein